MLMNQSNRRNRISSGPSSGTMGVCGEYGRMEILDAQRPASIGGPLSAIEQECRWLPDQRLLPDVREHEVRFRLLTFSDGQRRLLPAKGMHEYSPFAIRMGFEILKTTREMTDDHRGDYELMLKLHQRMQATKAYLRRQFSSIADLEIRLSGRGNQQSDRNVLPANLGLRADGGGRKWSIDRLLEEGSKSLARASGQLVPSAATRGFQGRMRIAHGLMAAAELDPLKRSTAEVRQLIRMSLLDRSQSAPPHPRKTKAQVLARLRSLWNAHLDDSHPVFRNWFQGGRSNLIKVLAELSGARGGKLDRDHVEWALLELSAESLWYAASCEHKFAIAVWQTISPRFEGLDRTSFTQVYLPQGYLGGLTLPLLAQRSHFLRPILARIMSEPNNRKLRPVLWRMLDYYIQMVDARRLADREVKKRTKTTSLPPAELVQTPSSFDAELAEEWLELIAVKCNMRCKNTRCIIRYSCDDYESPQVVINGICREHGALLPVRPSQKQVQEIIRKHKEG